MSNTEIITEKYLKGIVTVGHHYIQGQDNYGYYQKYDIGSFDLISTDLFDSSTSHGVSCCSGFRNPTYQGFLFRIAVDNGSGSTYWFLSGNRNAPLTVYIDNDVYELGAYKATSSTGNYFWRKTAAATALQQKYFNAEMLGKSFEITLKFDLA